MRRRTRTLRVKPRDRGKISIRRMLATFSDGDTVSIKINPSLQNIPHPRFKGKTGRVVGKQGRSYYVKITDGGKTKNILVPAEHLARAGGVK